MGYPRIGLKSHVIPHVQYMVVAGRIDRGLSFYGPFESMPQAYDWAGEYLDDDCAQEVIPLHTPSGSD